MNISYTMFGLGLAVGLFLGWIWDVARAYYASKKTAEFSPVVKAEVKNALDAGHVPPRPVPAPEPAPSPIPVHEVAVAPEAVASEVRRVFLQVDGERVQEVQEADFLNLLQQWGISADSPQGMALSNGQPVQIRSGNVQSVVQLVYA